MSKDSNLVVEFRKIPSLKFLYEVSEDGRIVRNVKSKHQLAMDKDSGRYFRVSPVLNGKQIHRFVHILVAECWFGPKPDEMECDHIDHNKYNNHYTNLRYVTREENLKKRIFSDEGRRTNGEITRNRYFSSSPEKQREIVAPMLEAAQKPENRLKAINASIAVTAHPVVLIKNNEQYYFESKSKCAHFISEQTGMKYGTVCHYIHEKRKFIHGYRVIYNPNKNNNAKKQECSKTSYKNSYERTQL